MQFPIRSFPKGGDNTRLKAMSSRFGTAQRIAPDRLDLRTNPMGLERPALRTVKESAPKNF